MSTCQDNSSRDIIRTPLPLLPPTIIISVNRRTCSTFIIAPEFLLLLLNSFYFFFHNFENLIFHLHHSSHTIAIMGFTDVDKLAINTIRLLAVSCSLLLFTPPTLSLLEVEAVLPRIIFLQTQCIVQRTNGKLGKLLIASLQVDATAKSNSGHPGAPMYVYTLRQTELESNISTGEWHQLPTYFGIES